APVQCNIRSDVAEYLAEREYDVRYGARPLKRAIERELLAPLAEELNRYNRETPVLAEVGMEGRRIKVRVRARSDETPTGRMKETNELAESVVQKRRLISRLLRCSATGKLEDEVALLE